MYVILKMDVGGSQNLSIRACRPKWATYVSMREEEEEENSVAGKKKANKQNKRNQSVTHADGSALRLYVRFTLPSLSFVTPGLVFSAKCLYIHPMLVAISQ